MARLSEQAERYEDMLCHVKQVTQMNVELTSEERNLFSIAYKNVSGSLRKAWRTISAIEQKKDNRRSEKQMSQIRQYRSLIEAELTKICNEMLSILDQSLIPTAQGIESRVFYYKMKGDYGRYMAEYLVGDLRDKVSQSVQEAYQQAIELASTQLVPTHPIRLGLALNYSVFCYEIQGAYRIACELAQKAFDEAITELDQVSEDGYKDSALIMQLLRDNITLWMSQHSNGGQELTETISKS
jgi:14-3-3 protein epsilon